MSETVRGAVAQRREDPPAVRVAKSYQNNFSEVLPDHIEPKAFVGSALGLLRKDPDLLAAANNNQTAFVNTLMECARLGHVPGSKEYYFTRRRDKASGNKEIIVGIEGYRGVIERMYRSGAVASVKVREVCKGDGFHFVEGEMDKPVHEVDWFAELDRTSPENIIGCYAYAVLTTGAISRVVILNQQDIAKAKQKSDAGRADKGPWASDYRAMVWKTAAHRLEPWVPTSAEYRREQLRAAVAADKARSERVDTTTGEIFDADVIDGETVGEEEQS